jgi:hypothetical protein
MRLEGGNTSLADPLLDQTVVAGIGKKYKSEITVYKSSGCSNPQIVFLYLSERLLGSIQEVLKTDYLNAGCTRPLCFTLYGYNIYLHCFTEVIAESSGFSSSCSYC